MALGWGLDNIYQRQQNTAADFPELSQVLRAQSKLLKSKSAIKPYNLPALIRLEQLSQYPLPTQLIENLKQDKIVVLDSEQGFTLYLLFDTKQLISLGPIKLEQSQNQWLDYFLTLAFYLSIALILLIWFKPLLSAVDRLSKALKQIKSGDLTARVPDSNYLNELNFEFNQMANRLEELNANNELFSQAVSHDIRTPLARILFALDHLEQNPKQNESQSSIEAIKKDVATINTLSSELLDYARIGQTKDDEVSEFDLVMLLNQIASEFEHLPCEIKFEHKFKQGFLVYSDVNLMQKMLRNLLENSSRYCKQLIKVKLEITNDWVLISIEDDGHGFDLSKNSYQDYISAFTTTEKKTGLNFGLGLTIVQRCAKRLTAHFDMNNESSLGGAKFMIKLPR